MLAQNERSTTPLHVVSQAASTSPDGQPPGPNTVKAGLTSRRPRRLVENDEYGAFAASSYARRVGNGDVEALALMLGLSEEIDTAIAGAGRGPARLRLFLGRDRCPARHHPLRRPATLGCMMSGYQGPLTHGFPQALA